MWWWQIMNAVMMKEPAMLEKCWGCYLKIKTSNINSILAISAFSNARMLLWVSVCKELAEADQSFSDFWELPSSIIWTWQSSIWKDKQDFAWVPLLSENRIESYFDNAERSFIIR